MLQSISPAKADTILNRVNKLTSIQRLDLLVSLRNVFIGVPGAFWWFISAAFAAVPYTRLLIFDFIVSMSFAGLAAGLELA